MDISRLLEVEVKEGKPPDMENNGDIEAYKNIPDFSIRDIASVRFRKLHCTACDVHIGSAPSSAHNMHEHPVLHVLLCAECRDFYGDGTFEQGDDATDMFCRWCANGGNLYCCSYCSNTFCNNCIKRNFDPMVRKKIERDEKWKCFVCNPADLYTARAACWALLQHVQTVTRILQTDRKMSPKEIEAKMNLDESQCCPHRSKRKHSETVSDDDEDEDETYYTSKRKRRKCSSGKRKRRVIKLEMQETLSEATNQESTNNERQIERVAMRQLEHLYSTNAQGNRTENPHPNRDRTVNLTQDELPLAERKQNRRLRVETPILPKFPITDDDIPATLLECDQTMIEGAESLSFDGANVPTAPTCVTLNVETPRNIGINPVPMANLMKIPEPPNATRIGDKTHRLIRGLSGTPVLVRKMSPANFNNIGKSSSTVQSLPMVTIPSSNHMQPINRVSVIQQNCKTNQDSPSSTSPTITSVQPLQLVSKSSTPASRNANTFTNAPPSVIDLDSDSDDPVVLVTPSNERSGSGNLDNFAVLSTETYPISSDDGFMTILEPTPRTNRTETRNVLRDRENSAPLDETIRDATKSIAVLLDSLKTKLKKVVESAILFSHENDLLVAKNKARAVHRTIKRTIGELNSFNDNLIRAYRDYKRERTKDKATHTDLVRLVSGQRSQRFIPLHMECTRESEPELDETLSEDGDDENDDSLVFPPAREITSIRRKVHRATDATPETKNKSVQVYDEHLCDYDKSVSYALLLRAEYDAKRQRDILRPVAVPDENFGKYEETFINYLQHIEDHGIETEETKQLENGDGISINELVEADIPMLINQMTNVEPENGANTKENSNDENVEILEEHVEIFTTKSIATDETSSSGKSETSEDGNTRRASSTTATTSSEKKNENSTTKSHTIEHDASRYTKSTVSKEKKDWKVVPAEENTDRVDSTVNDEIESRKDVRPGGKGTVDEETVLAVRALIEEGNDGDRGKTDLLNSWKPVESDDECTILD